MEEPQQGYLVPYTLEEIARLLAQDRLFTQQMLHIFTPDEWKGIFRVLDLGCGPGGWCLEMAARHPQTQFVGGDISSLMLDYARMIARGDQIHNVDFQRLDITQPFDLPAQSFDLVNGRLVASFLTEDQWPLLLQRCRTLLKPGGLICVTEFDLAISNSKAMERLNTLFCLAGLFLKRGFSVSGRTFGPTMRIVQMLQERGFIDVEYQGIVINSSHGSEGFEDAVAVTHLMNVNFRPFIVDMAQVVSGEEYDALCQQAREDMNQESYCAMSYHLSVRARTPS